MKTSKIDKYQKTNIAIGLIISIVVICCYNLLFFNKFFPLSEGWFSVFAKYVNDGAVPYRDFHFFLPPVYPIIISFFIKIFGPSIIALKILGITVILLMTSLLYMIYRRVFPPYAASFAAVISMIYYQSNVAHVQYDFLHFMMIFALLGLFFICKAFDDEIKKSSMTFSLILAGIFGSLAFLTKQSNGIFVPLFSALAVVVCSLKLKQIQYTFKTIASYCVGVIILPVITLFWLYFNAALTQFIEQVFLGASQSKGSLTAILFAWIPRLYAVIFEKGILPLIFGLFILVAVLYKNIFKTLDKKTAEFQIKTKPEYYFGYFLIPLVILIAILLPFVFQNLSVRIFGSRTLDWLSYKPIILITCIITLLMILVYLKKIIFNQDQLDRNVFVILSVSVGLIFGTGTSGGVGDAGLILSFGLIFGFLISRKSQLNIGKYLALILAIVIVLFFASKKYVQPYSWWDVSQPDIRTATESIDNRYLKGILFSKENAKIYSETISIIQKNCLPGEPIYVFPNMQIFYLISERWPDTFSKVNWYDVLPDKYAIQEACHIEISKPKIILFLDMPVSVVEAHEIMFRKGQLSGQREIIRAIKNLCAEGGEYSLEREFVVPNGCILKVWVRKQKLKEINGSVK